MKLLIEISEESRPVLEQINGLENSQPLTFSKVRRLDSVYDTLQILIPFTLATLPFITKVIVTLIQAKKDVTVKCQGVEISGLSETNAMRVLGQLLEGKDSDETNSEPT